MTAKQYPVVNTHNEWDPLEEIIVGTVEGALVPPWDVVMEATLHGEDLWAFFKKHVDLLFYENDYGLSRLTSPAEE